MTLVIALLAGGVAYFAANWFFAARQVAKMTELELRQARINDETRQRSKRSLAERFRLRVRVLGWRGDLAPVLVLLTFMYLLCAVALSVIGFDGLIGVALALPVAAVAAYVAATTITARRKRQFNVQLIQALDLLASQLRAGAGPNRAIEMVLPSLPDPLRSELSGALDQSRAARPLADAIGDIGERYPSRAMSMFVAALKIDQEQGGKITDALEQAAASVRKDFELNAEALAEISQDKAQFFGIVGIVVMIGIYTFSQGDEQTREALTSTMGLTALGLGFANFAFGVFRTLRLFAKARGGY